MLRRVHLVDAPEQRKRVARRQLVPQLRALAEHRANAKRERVTLVRRHEAEHANGSGIRMQNPREDLERRRFAGAVRTDECDALTRANRE
jgi:hypothetical protein